ncbi:hypothetical protein EVAR_78797_1 [Eumeta japonica]|uniref:Uncharacterized protein n=1 Tax=Eumeta variegata TaxID=151549 RepID=A0A4C1T1M7_EUMVA|nr:hypothetical protein EVAR_78797_1 [Eumeta japonica]
MTATVRDDIEDHLSEIYAPVHNMAFDQSRAQQVKVAVPKTERPAGCVTHTPRARTRFHYDVVITSGCGRVLLHFLGGRRRQPPELSLMRFRGPPCRTGAEPDARSDRRIRMKPLRPRCDPANHLQ